MNPAQGTPDRGPVDQEQHETIRCLCRFDREEGNMVSFPSVSPFSVLTFQVPCKECKTWQHGHCSGYYDLHAIPAAGEHRCATCQAPRSDVDRERWLEQCETYAFIRRVLFLLRNGEFVAHNYLCKLMGKTGPGCCSDDLQLTMQSCRRQHCRRCAAPIAR